MKIFFPLNPSAKRSIEIHFILLGKWRKIFLTLWCLFLLKFTWTTFCINKLRGLCLSLCGIYIPKGLNLIQKFSDSVSPGELRVRMYMRYLYTWKWGNSWKVTWKPDYMDTASGSYSLSLLYRLDCVCNYRENFNSVLPWPYSLGDLIPLMILGS